MKKIMIIIIGLFLVSLTYADNVYQLEDIDIYSEDGATGVVVALSHLDGYSSFGMTNPNRIILEFYNTAMPAMPPTYKYFPPVERVSLQPLADHTQGIRLTIEYSESADYSLGKLDNTIKIDFTDSPTRLDQSKKESSGPAWLQTKVNLVMEDGQVSAALNIISREAGFDLVVSDLDEKAIWVNLRQVPVEEAIQAILKASGNTYFINGRVVVVTGQSEDKREGMESQVYSLKYADAAGFAEAVKEILSPGAGIKIIEAVSGDDGGDEKQPRYLLLTDTAEKHKIIRGLLSDIDVKPRQIAISVKFIETNISGETTLGIDWNKTVEANLTDTDPSSTEGDGATSSGLAGYSPWPPKKGSFVWGTLTISEATAVLNYLDDSGKSRLLSDPSVTTSDGKKATISVTTTIPIQTVNRFSEGAVVQDIVTFDYKEVGIVLNVVPKINEPGRITLSCQPTVEEITGWVGPTNNQQPITTKRSVETEVVVTNGETVVIGGLYKESKIENESKLWLLGDIPILGYLFKTKNTTTNKTDLMIFITPEIVE
ncbi:MAG: AMIN domain-containing protein [candidate division Zixibacteria bacterium]|nr:AMIN domain-containing protein [candidate division Zixibacteria bacterium]